MIEQNLNIMGEVQLDDDVMQHLNVFIVKSRLRFKIGQYGTNILILIYHYNS